MTSPTPPQPLCAPRCPLCGEPNRCVPAATGRFDPPCWCAGLTIAPATLARVQADQRRLACLCERCARAETP